MLYDILCFLLISIYVFCPRSASEIKPLDAIQELVSEAEHETWDDGYVHADSEYDSEVSSEISMVVRTGVDATADARIDTQNDPGIPSRDQIKVSAKGMANSGEEEFDEESVRRLDNGTSRELESELNSVRKEQSDRETDEADEAAEIISKGSPDKLMGRGRGRKWHQALTVRNGEFLRSSTKKVILPAPCPSIKPTAWITAIRLDTTPTAPEALVEICPTKKVSARL